MAAHLQILLAPLLQLLLTPLLLLQQVGQVEGWGGETEREVLRRTFSVVMDG